MISKTVAAIGVIAVLLALALHEGYLLVKRNINKIIGDDARSFGEIFIESADKK